MLLVHRKYSIEHPAPNLFILHRFQALQLVYLYYYVMISYNFNDDEVFYLVYPLSVFRSLTVIYV